MNKKTNTSANTGAEKTTDYSKYGTTTIAFTLIVVALTIFANLLVSLLPSNILEIDTSDQKIYSLSDTSKEYVSHLEENVQLILVAEEANMDERILKFCTKYAALSNKISVTTIDPVEYPSVLDTYEIVPNTLVILNTDTGKFTSYAFGGVSNALIAYALDFNNSEYYETAFDAEGQITSGIDYVTGEANENIYALDGHNETTLSDSILALIAKTNVGYKGKINLLRDGMPEDCDLLICHVPTTDLADDELDMIRSYMSEGGNFFLIVDDVTLPNLTSLVNEYGLQFKPGTVGDTENYYKNYSIYYGDRCIKPELSTTHPITTHIYSLNAITLYARAMEIATPARDAITIKSFMTTSDAGVIYDENSEQVETGSYVLGATAVETLSDTLSSQFTVVSTAYMFNEKVTSSFTNMCNLDLFVNIVTSNFGDVSTIIIPAKSLEVTYNTIDSYAVWSILFIGVIPGLTLIGGLIFWLSRRKH